MESEETYAKSTIAWLKRELVKQGYRVSQNVLLDSEGIKHKFDLIAEKEILPGIKIRLGFILVSDKVNVELVEKLLGWFDEYRSLKIIIIALDNVDPQAHLLATRYGIDILKPPYEVFAKTPTYEETHEKVLFIKPIVDVNYIIKFVKDKTKPSLLRPTKCVLEKLALVFYPLIKLSIELPISEEIRGSAEVIEGDLLIDGVNGFFAKINAYGLRIIRDYKSILEIPDEAINILRVLSEDKSIELEALSARTRIELHTLKSLLIELSMHNLIDIYGDLVEYKGIDPKLITNFEDIAKKHKLAAMDTLPFNSDKTLVITSKIPYIKLEEIIASTGTKLRDRTILYYPVFVALIKEHRGEVIREKVLVYDGITGDENSDLAIELTNPGFLDKLRSLKGYRID